MPEVLGDSAVYFDPESPKEIEQAIQQLLDDASLRESVAARAFERASHYTWSKCSDETFRFIREVAEQRGEPS